MLCHLGLFAGIVVGSMLGGPWIFIAPTAEFVIGLITDTKLMRGSHKGHEGHGGHGMGCCGSGYESTQRQEESVKDPVCGMEVDEKTTGYKAEFRGKTYYFCSSTCESTFKENPEKYVG